ncbi:MAG: hypothetical protein ACETWQ_10715 [Phycisphaerae bacterium]
MEVKENKPSQATAMKKLNKRYEKLKARQDEKNKLDQETAMRTRNEISEKFYLRPDQKNGSWFGEDLGVEVRVVPAGQEIEERFRQLIKIANGEMISAED